MIYTEVTAFALRKLSLKKKKKKAKMITETQETSVTQEEIIMLYECYRF